MVESYNGRGAALLSGNVTEADRAENLKKQVLWEKRREQHLRAGKGSGGDGGGECSSSPGDVAHPITPCSTLENIRVSDKILRESHRPTFEELETTMEFGS